MPDDSNETGFYVVDKSVEEDALDTMLETSVVELDQALGGIGNYDGSAAPTPTLDHHHEPTNDAASYLPVDSSVISPPMALGGNNKQLPALPTIEQPPEHAANKMISPPVIAILARDKVFQSDLALPPYRRSKTRRTNAASTSKEPVSDNPCVEIRTGRWTLDEKLLFLYGLQKYGMGKWKWIQFYCPGR